jgi:hypothetical protein
LSAAFLQLSGSSYKIDGTGTNFSIGNHVNPLSGDHVLAIGQDSGVNNYGSHNIFVGLSAGFTNLSGHGNIIVGRNANTLTNGLSNTIVFGNFATASASNQIAIGSESFPLSTTTTAGSVSRYLVVALNGVLGKIPVHNL